MHKIPFENVAIDIVGPFPRSHGYRILLTYICLASKYPEANSTKACHSPGMCRSVTGNAAKRPRCSVFLKQLCLRLRVRQMRTTPYHPQSNGSVERMHGTLVPMLRKLARKDIPWDDQVKFALYAIRATPNKSSYWFCPIQGYPWVSSQDVVVQERDPGHSKNVKAIEWLDELNKRVSTIREEVLKNVGKAQCERKERHNRQAVTRTFSVG